jgi:hypothetical protein
VIDDEFCSIMSMFCASPLVVDELCSTSIDGALFSPVLAMDELKSTLSTSAIVEISSSTLS